MSLAHRVNSFEAPLFRLNLAADLAEFQALLAQTDAGFALLNEYQEGDLLTDAFSGMSLRVIGPRPNILRQVIGENCQVRRMTALSAISEFSLVKVSTNGLNVTKSTLLGESTAGIALNSCGTGEGVYVLTQGVFLLAEGASPPTLQGFVTTDGFGLAQAAGVGNFSVGIALAIGVSINSVAYSLVTIGGQPVKIA